MDGRPLSIPEVAERLNTAERFVRRLVEERRIPFHRFGKYIRIYESDLAAYIAAGRVEAHSWARKAA